MYLYNGKELQPDFDLNWLDYGARMYDPVVARWWGVDPLADSSRNLTPYHYCVNNPINIIDPDGRDTLLLTMQQRLYEKLPEGGVANIHNGTFAGQFWSCWGLSNKGNDDIMLKGNTQEAINKMIGIANKVLGDNWSNSKNNKMMVTLKK